MYPCVHAKSFQSCPLCDPMDYSLPVALSMSLFSPNFTDVENGIKGRSLKN